LGLQSYHWNGWT